jgi:hypothetical protein
MTGVERMPEIRDDLRIIAVAHLMPTTAWLYGLKYYKRLHVSLVLVSSLYVRQRMLATISISKYIWATTPQMRYRA